MTHNKKVFTETLKAWTPLAIVIILMSGLVYVTVQQNYRQSANDPQIQIGEDIATALSQGAATPDQIAPPTGTTDIQASLSPFVMVYDSNGTLVGSTAILDGKNPSYPSGVFAQVKASGKEAHVTWQPASGVRIASVVVPYSSTAPALDASSSPQTVSGYIVAGRNIREIEIRENMLALMSLLAALFTLLVTFLVVWLFKRMDHREVTVTETTIEISQDKIS